MSVGRLYPDQMIEWTNSMDESPGSDDSGSR